MRNRIKKARKDNGYKSARALEKKLNEEFGGRNPLYGSCYGGNFDNNEYIGFISYGRLNKIESEKSPENIKVQELIAISEVLKVDIDYLLGLQDEKRKEIKDLKELTGLSEKACTILASCGKAISPKDDDAERSVEQQRVEQNELLSWLIENGFMQWLIAYNCTVNNWWKEHSYNPFDLEEQQREINKDEIRTAIIQNNVRLIKADMYYLERELSKLIHDGFVAIGREREKNE